MNLGIKLIQLLLKIRYRVEITGLDLLEKEKSHLILPSHVALMDPVIIYSYLREKWNIRPIISETYYKAPLLHTFFRVIQAVPVVDLEKHDKDNLDTEQLLNCMIDSLSSNWNVLLYPQWEMARQWFQSIIGKKTAYYVVQNLPKDVKILTININWLWWSRSSWAWNWKSPKLGCFLLKWLLFTIANLFCFVPKRNVKIEIQDKTNELKKICKKGVNDFNQELEKIYNIKWEEKIEYISWLSRYNTVKNHKYPEKIQWSITDKKWNPLKSYSDVPEDILKKITDVIQKIKVDYKWKIEANTNLVLDCLFDSLDMAELKTTVQSLFKESSNPPLLDLKTVWDVALMAMWQSVINEELKPCNRVYSNNKTLLYNRLKPLINKDSTILSIMKYTFSNGLDESFCYDQTFWIQTKKDFLIRVYLIADILKTFPWNKIAIMLPSLSATSLIIAACYIADKVPVMLNRTQSEEAFKHCLKSQEIDIILTSKTFFKQIQTPWLKKYNMTFFEELLSKISIYKKIKAFMQAKNFHIPSKIQKTAVVLFTSWSEALPKTVELTHQNILQDILWAVGNVWVTSQDIEIAYLPPFHSFGFVIGTIVPLISWMRVVFTPDPNDSRSIANLISHTKSSLLASTPTFLRWIIQSAEKDQINSLRIAIVWAEKCSKDLFLKLAKLAPSASIIEWYGITECSPIIAVNPLRRNMQIKRWTVGLPILWEKIKILDIDSLKELPPKKEWMIYVRWTNIFAGYWDKWLESPFVAIDGEQRYKTWDLWFLDNDWYLTISWRLKRFVKIAWEMISLPAIETTLAKKWKTQTGEECFSLEAEEKDWDVKLTLFTIENIDLREVNAYLHEQWASNLVHIDEIRQIYEIPMLWTWKVDHVKLQKIMKGETVKSKKK